MIDRIISRLETDEGWRSEPYQDVRGVWTVGFGFVIDGRKPWTLPREVGNHWLRYLVERRYEELLSRWDAFADQPTEVQEALVQMSYQLGVSGVLNFKRMIAALENGDRAAAAVEALDSQWGRRYRTRAGRLARVIGGPPPDRSAG